MSCNCFQDKKIQMKMNVTNENTNEYYKSAGNKCKAKVCHEQCGGL